MMMMLKSMRTGKSGSAWWKSHGPPTATLFWMPEKRSWSGLSRWKLTPSRPCSSSVKCNLAPRQLSTEYSRPRPPRGTKKPGKGPFPPEERQIWSSPVETVMVFSIE